MSLFWSWGCRLAGVSAKINEPRPLSLKSVRNAVLKLLAFPNPTVLRIMPRLASCLERSIKSPVSSKINPCGVVAWPSVIKIPTRATPLSRGRALTIQSKAKSVRVTPSAVSREMAVLAG